MGHRDAEGAPLGKETGGFYHSLCQPQADGKSSYSSFQTAENGCPLISSRGPQSEVLEKEGYKAQIWQKIEKLWGNFNSWPGERKATSCKEPAF